MPFNQRTRSSPVQRIKRRQPRSKTPPKVSSAANSSIGSEKLRMDAAPRYCRSAREVELPNASANGVARAGSETLAASALAVASPGEPGIVDPREASNRLGMELLIAAGVQRLAKVHSKL